MNEESKPDFFRGREGGNNERIMEMLSPNLAYDRKQIKGILDRRYSVTYDRLKDLEARGIIQKRGERVAEKNRVPVPLFGLTSYGLYVAAVHLSNTQARDSALEECRKRIMGHWKTFSNIYELIEVGTDKPLYTEVTRWVENNPIQIIRSFGHKILSNETEALVAFRRMIGEALLLFDSQPVIGIGTSLDRDNENNVKSFYVKLAELAIKHPELSKLHRTLREVDAALYAHLRSDLVKRITELLSKGVPMIVAKKLATTPLFCDDTTGMISLTEYCIIADKPLTQVIRDVKKTLQEDRKLQRKLVAGHNWIVIEEDGLSLVTEDPNRISPEWQQHSSIYSLDRGTGKVRPWKGERTSAKRLENKGS